MKKVNIVLLLIVFSLINASAQKRKTRGTTKPIVTQETPQDKLFKSMLRSTAKVMFIDSLVVDKDSFLARIPLNHESGYLYATKDGVNGYMNEFGNRTYYSAESDSARHLYSADKLGEDWEKGTMLDGIGDEYSEQNFPFLMSDGITLFFAAKGKHSLGGYDIFTTMFDSQSGQFYVPQNYGLPFNSRANDYLLAIDEIDTIGWLVSDRFQPDGKVCIYTFVPTTPRQSFDGEDISNEELSKYANLNAIDETWQFGNRKTAIVRLESMKAREEKKYNTNAIAFAINDDTVYHDIHDFKSSNNRQLFLEWKGQKILLASEEEKLHKLRESYAKGNKSMQQRLQQEIIRTEENVEQQRLSLHQKEKSIRNNEINILK